MINSFGTDCDACQCLAHHSVVDNPHVNAIDTAFTAAELSRIASDIAVVSS